MNKYIITAISFWKKYWRENYRAYRADQMNHKHSDVILLAELLERIDYDDLAQADELSKMVVILLDIIPLPLVEITGAMDQLTALKTINDAYRERRGLGDNEFIVEDGDRIRDD